MKKIFLVGLMAVGVLFTSCDFVVSVAGEIFKEAIGAGSSSSGFIKPSPGDSKTIKGRAYNIAVDYVNQYTKYQSGAMGRAAIPFDCSGLVTRCYVDALQGTGYKLPYNYSKNGHASAQQIYDSAVKHIRYEDLQKGDIVFLNFNRNSNRVTHVGIFVDKLTSGEFRFIDASDYSSYEKVVDFRKIDRYDRAVIGFGEMKFVNR